MHIKLQTCFIENSTSLQTVGEFFCDTIPEKKLRELLIVAAW